MNCKTMSAQELATLIANKEPGWQEAWEALIINRCGSIVRYNASKILSRHKSALWNNILENAGLKNPDDIFAALLKDYADGKFGAFERLDVRKGLIKSALKREKKDIKNQIAENYEVIHPESSRITPELSEILIKNYIGASVWGYCLNRLRQFKEDYERVLNTRVIVEEKSEDSVNREIEIPDFSSWTDEHVINRITLEQVFRKLLEKKKKVVSLYYSEGLTQEEIAEQLGFKDHSSISRILRDFRRELEQSGFDPQK